MAFVFRLHGHEYSLKDMVRLILKVLNTIIIYLKNVIGHVEPFVTLHHFDTPETLHSDGDFLNRKLSTLLSMQNSVSKNLKK